ncbi:MAG TPA: NYN domain-containing protein [Actinomycetes bacterium]
MPTDEERIALFIDHENLVLGARDIGRTFDIGPIMDALAERGRVVARRAYADWTLFSDDRRSLVQHNCELIDIPQRTGMVRKNAADIKLAVDAMELAYERGFVSTFVIASGDSDFTPLVAALRALNRRVIGIGVKGSTSNLLPPACDEFLFYDRLPGVSEPPGEPPKRPATSGNGAAKKASGGAKRNKRQAPVGGDRDLQDLQRVITQTLAGLKQSGAEPVLASTLKRAVLRKDPTFSEADYGFRAFGELLRQLERNGAISLADGAAPGDPAVDFPAGGQGDQAFSLLQATVKALQGDDEDVPLSGLKDQLRKRNPGWSEKDLGYAGFLQFVRAAASSGAVAMEWDEEEGDYFLYVPS